MGRKSLLPCLLLHHPFSSRTTLHIVNSFRSFPDHPSDGISLLHCFLQSCVYTEATASNGHARSRPPPDCVIPLILYFHHRDLLCEFGVTANVWVCSRQSQTHTSITELSPTFSILSVRPPRYAIQNAIHYIQLPSRRTPSKSSFRSQLASPFSVSSWTSCVPPSSYCMFAGSGLANVCET